MKLSHGQINWRSATLGAERPGQPKQRLKFVARLHEVFMLVEKDNHCAAWLVLKLRQYDMVALVFYLVLFFAERNWHEP